MKSITRYTSLALFMIVFLLLSGCSDTIVDSGHEMLEEEVTEEIFIENPAPEPVFADGDTAGKAPWTYLYSAWYAKYYWYQHFYDKGYCDVKYGIITGCYYYSSTN